MGAALFGTFNGLADRNSRVKKKKLEENDLEVSELEFDSKRTPI
jgi:hypothetical protein